jgi:phage terminase large subunit-like protein
MVVEGVVSTVPDLCNPNLKELQEYMFGLFNFTFVDYQLAFTYDCLMLDRIVGVFCRQEGKSTTVAAASILLAYKEGKGDKVMIFAPTDRQTMLIAEKVSFFCRQLPMISDFKLIRQTAREFEFSNGSKIICDTVGDSGEGIRGYTAKAIILEEAGTIKDSIIENVILPMGATTDAKIIKIGTPRGKNHFFESHISPLYAKHLYDYTYGVRAGVLSQKYVDEMRVTLSPEAWRTEIMAEFIEDQDAYFPYDLVDSCRDNSLSWTSDLVLKERCTYYMGADIARLGQDSTCLVIVEVGVDKIGRVVKIEEYRQKTLDFVLDRIIELTKKYKFKRVFVDETGLGAGVSDLLAKQFNMKRIEQGQQIAGFPKHYFFSDKIIGVKFTIKSKLDMFSNLKIAMIKGLVKYPNNPKLIAQLRDFRYELTENMNVKLHHPDGGFDDYVDALVLACRDVTQSKPSYTF